jgi:hypothetical protein
MKKTGLSFCLLLLSSLLFSSGCTTTGPELTAGEIYAKAIIGYWVEGDSPYAVADFLEGGQYRGWLYKDRTKAETLVEMAGKWWIKDGQLFNELTDIYPPVPGFEIGDIVIDQIVSISDNEMVLIDQDGRRYSNYREK